MNIKDLNNINKLNEAYHIIDILVHYVNKNLTKRQEQDLNKCLDLLYDVLNK